MRKAIISNLKRCIFSLLIEFIGEIAMKSGRNRGKSVRHVRWNQNQTFSDSKSQISDDLKSSIRKIHSMAIGELYTKRRIIQTSKSRKQSDLVRDEELICGYQLLLAFPNSISGENKFLIIFSFFYFFFFNNFFFLCASSIL